MLKKLVVAAVVVVLGVVGFYAYMLLTGQIVMM